MYSDRFGYIPMRLDLIWNQGQLRTLEQYDQVCEWFQSALHPDGHFYPPIQKTMRGWPDEDAVPVPGSERGALLYRLPATHELVLVRPAADPEVMRKGMAGFIIHFLGFLLGRRCQFDEWWIDGRVSFRATTDAVPHAPVEVSLCLDKAHETWSKIPERTRIVLTNAFYLHSRAPAYEWDWERFTIEYQVFDALFSVAGQTHGLKAARHSDRFKAVSDAYGLWYDQEVIERLVKLRNDLFHEVLWGGVMPGSTAPDDAFYMPIWLHAINQRLGLAVLGLEGPYLASRWQSLGTWVLDLNIFGEHRSTQHATRADAVNTLDGQTQKARSSGADRKVES